MSFFRYGLIWAACLQMLDPVYSPKVHVKPGKDVTLPCQGHNPIELLKWTKQDLYMYVFFHRDNRSYPNYQNLSFRGRVQLRDPEMKDGDVSIIIRNVTINDTGRYECSTAEKNIGTTPKLNHIVDLKVDSDGNTRTEGDKDENLRGYVGLAVVAGLIVVAVGSVLIFRMYPLPGKYSHLSSAKKSGDQQDV